MPLLLHYERALHSVPVIALLIDLLELAPRFRRRDLLDALRSPYIDAGLDAELVDLLDRLSMEQQFLGGDRSAWLEIVQLAGQPLGSHSEEIQRTPIDPPRNGMISARAWKPSSTGSHPPNGPTSAVMSYGWRTCWELIRNPITTTSRARQQGAIILATHCRARQSS